jgi:hypothetical protein
MPFTMANCAGNGELAIGAQSARMEFIGGIGTYEFRIKFEHGSGESNGLTTIYHLDGWDSVAYLAIGHTVKNEFRHIKIRHVVQDEWQVASFSAEDLAYLVQNNFESVEPSAVVDLRLYVKGQPSAGGAGVSVAAACSWRFDGNRHPFARGTGSDEGGFSLQPELRSCLSNYLRGTNESLTGHVRTFLDTGNFPIHGDIFLDWGIRERFPPLVADNPTFRYIWHSLYPAAYMAVYARDNMDPRALPASRDLVLSWLRDNYYRPSSDMRYAWYDHGTAERLISLLVILDGARLAGSDVRFIRQMEEAIWRHAQLLESDSFYAANQNSRFHNHAWFQDIALMAAGIASHHPEGRRWIEKAQHRLSGQFHELIIRDSGYAVFAENSIGYHHGIQSLVSLAGKMIELSGGSREVSEVAAELDLWSEYLRYPDRRSPSQGDTFHLANAEQIRPSSRIPYDEPHANVLASAGYGVAKGNHYETPFMVCFFATSQSKTHKHEDNLSFTLFFDGIEWLVDPSFYSHDYSEPIPAYLRSAWAHNTVAVVGQAQSIEPHLATLSGTYSDSDFEFNGTHWAYENLSVRREMSGSLTELSIKILDTVVQADNSVDARSVFHLGEGVVPTVVPGGVHLEHQNSEHKLLLSCATLPKMYHGVANLQEEMSVIGTSFGRYEDSYSLHFAHDNVKAVDIVLTVVVPGSD